MSSTLAIDTLGFQASGCFESFHIQLSSIRSEKETDTRNRLERARTEVLYSDVHSSPIFL